MEVSQLYEQDFYAWAMKNAELPRQGQISEVDTMHLAEGNRMGAPLTLSADAQGNRRISLFPCGIKSVCNERGSAYDDIFWSL
jgi:Domain of unknown function DUF29